MPNHVEGLIRILGDEKDLKDIMEFVKDEDKCISADKIIPYPEKFKKMDEDHYARYGNWGESTPEQKVNASEDIKNGTYTKDGYNNGGYNWCCNNWGTKWGFYNTKVSDIIELPNGEFVVEYTVRTAWSPAFPVIRRLSELYPNVTIEYWYEEEGWCYPAGRVTYNGGDETDDEIWEDINDWKAMEIFEPYADWLKSQEDDQTI